MLLDLLDTVDEADSAYQRSFHVSRARRLIRAIVPHTHVHMAAQSEAEIGYIRESLAARGFTEQELEEHVSFHVIPHNDLWFRDTGGVFMQPVSGEGKQQVIDFNFNTWGFGFLVAADEASAAAEMLDEAVDREIASALSLPTIKTELYAEGGAFSSDGKGTILAPERVMKQRNPGASLKDMEAELLHVFSADKVIWLPGYAGTDRNPVDGPYVIDGQPVYAALAVGGHLDQIARFVSEVYMNYVVTNDVVLVPKYADQNPDAGTHDTAAKTALEAAFPGRTVVQIHPKAFNVGGGGMHCVTLEMWTAE